MRLANVLDLAAARPLWTQLCDARQQPIAIDASEVERLGGLCMQVLLAARKAWEADGVAFAICHPSKAFIDAARLMSAVDLIAAEDCA